MKREIIVNHDGVIAFTESDASMSISIEGYGPAKPVEDKEWVKLRGQMGTHDISLNKSDNTIKSTKRKEHK